MGVNIDSLKRDIHVQIDRMPKVLGEATQSSGVTATRRINEVLIKAEEISKQFEDSYISVEHVMLAMIDIDKNGAVGEILRKK